MSNIKFVFSVCYYSRVMYPLLIAAKWNNINFIDIQHGKQGQGHLCYDFKLNNNIKKPILPDFFWNWNNYSASNIAKGLNPDWKITTINGGYLWNKFYKSKNYKSNDLIRIKKLAQKFQKVLLLGTQPVDDGFFDPWILEGIKKNKNILFLIRLHPFQKVLEIPNLESIIKLENVESELSSSLNLVDLLDLSDVVISKWSSISFEAAVMGKKAIVIHQNGLNSFEDLINLGLVNYCHSFKDIIKETYKERFHYNIDWFNYEKSEDLIDKSINLVLDD